MISFGKRPVSGPQLAILTLGLLSLSLLFPATLMAQITTGTILGTVSDASGAVLPGATVTATNLDTGLVRATITNEAGAYTLVNLPIGNYQVKVQASGFKVGVSGPFQLVVDQKLRSDFRLDAGNVTESIQVAGTGQTQLQTDQPDVNQIVQEREIKGLPLNGRDFFSLLLLSNGVQDTSNDQTGATTNVTFSINGMRPESNSVTLDGIEMSSIRESDVDLRPNIDAVSEFKVLTSVFSSEYGHTAGGVISIQSKSGTNEFHGSLFEFLRNDALNAANFFRNPVNPDKAPLKQNQFGGTFGGPIRKNKTFYFLDYQEYKLRRTNEAFAVVPEIPFRDGDFSSLLASGIGVYDPATDGAVQFKDQSRATPGNPQGLNIIPRNKFNSFGSYLLNSVALPNLPANFPLGNYFVQQRRRYTQHDAGIRVDHSFSSKDSMFVRYRWNDGFLNDADPLSRADGPTPGIGGGYGSESRGIVQGGTHRDRNNNMVLSEVHVFNPKLVNEARVGFHRYHLDVLSHAFGLNLAERFGLKGTNTDQLFSGLPAIYLNAYTNIGEDDFKPLYFRETSIQFNDNLTYTLGKHSLKVGGEYRRRGENNYYALFPAGSFYFFPYRTSKDLSFVEGHELAEVLLGLPLNSFHGRRFSSALLKDRQYSFFIQEDWKVTDRLTLNLGVRYEYLTPFFSPTDEISMFDLEQKKLLLAGRDGVSRYIVEPDRNNWAPRIGFAYKFNPKTTLRGGFGVFYDPATAFRDDIKFNPPFYRQIIDFDGWKFSDPAPPPFLDPGPLPKGYDLFSIDRRFRIGYSEQYSLAVQRELPGKMLFEAAYVGAQAHKLPFRFDLNQAQPRGGSKPAPELGKIQVVSNVGNLAYHSGQFKLERRFGDRLFFLASYTWSKAIDNVGSSLARASANGGVQNVFDPKLNRAVADYDVPHRLAFSYVYVLPFGKGQRWLSAGRPALNAALGNWQITGLFITSSGAPGTVVVADNDNIPGGRARPNLIRNPNLPSSERSVDRWFDTGAFVANRDSKGNLLPGSAGRNIFRGPGYTNFDLGLAKFFPITERFRLQFRAEFFNLTNTPHFALPVRTMNDPAFGQITHTRNPANFGSTATSYANRQIQLALKLEF